jgi:hypothetical protein
MKRVVASLVAGGMLASAMALAGCENSTSAVYDPQYDGVTPLEHPHPDLTILENQKTLYEKLAAASPAAARPGTAPANNATPAAPAGAPASPPPPPPG